MKVFLLAIAISICSSGWTQIDQASLTHHIDSLVQLGLDSAAYPGCQVVVLHQGSVVHQRSYGHHTYARQKPVEDHQVYDLASLTKVTTGLPLLMYLYGQGGFDIDATIPTYLPRFRRSNKADLKWKEVLTHQAGLVPWLPHWQNTLKKNGRRFRARTFKSNKNQRFSIQVSDHLYLHRMYPRKMVKAVRKSPLGEKTYKYSGILFYLMPEMISSIMNEPFEQELYEKIYNPIGAESLRYQPLSHFPKNDIIPTEYDSLFRKTLVHGIVHDEGAAMMDGISCNAGLFGNAGDLAKLGQLYAQYGRFRNQNVLDSNAVKIFGQTHYPDNRRGLGFDKPLLSPDDNWIGPCGPSATPNSFGHSGFTGTYMWVDPDQNLVFVFLSNRVHPTRANRKLYTMNLRQLLHQACYEALVD